MSLLEANKAERRARILAAARELIAARGYDGLTMRELAAASRVSVPTLYNLFGGKQAILLGELEETFAAIAAGFEHALGKDVAERALAACDVANRELLSAPAYSRELVNLFLASEETRALRQQTETRYVELLADSLRAAQAAGEVASWADPVAVARRQYAHYIQVTVQWAQGDYDDETFQAFALYGLCLLLLGITRGESAKRLARKAEQLQKKTAVTSRGRRRQGAKR